MTRMIKCKCKDCTKRQVGCHSTCEDYKAFRAELDAVNAEKLKQSKAVYEITSEIAFRVERARKRGSFKGKDKGKTAGGRYI